MPTGTDVIADSQNTTITFANTSLSATSIKAKVSQTTVDASTLTLASGSPRALQSAPLKDGDTFTVEFLGTTAPTVGVAGSLVISGAIAANVTAICEELEITAAVGELVKGTCTLKVVPDPNE